MNTTRLTYSCLAGLGFGLLALAAGFEFDDGRFWLFVVGSDLLYHAIVWRLEDG